MKNTKSTVWKTRWNQTIFIGSKEKEKPIRDI